MDSAYLKELECMKERLLKSMEDYMTGEKFDNVYDVSYNSSDIVKCSRILDAYVDGLDRLDDHASESDIMAHVRNTVLRLNELAADRPDLIEAAESDALCDFMEFAAKGAGLKDIDRDITETWREW